MRRIYFSAIVSLILSALAAGGVFASSPLTPSINIVTVAHYSLEDVLYIEGVAWPDSDVEIMFERADYQPVTLNAKANANGEWSLNRKLELADGEWMVRARAKSGQDVSEWSGPRVIKSVVSGFRAGSITIKYAYAVLLLAFLIASSVIILAYVVIKIRANANELRRLKDIEADIERQIKTWPRK